MWPNKIIKLFFHNSFAKNEKREQRQPKLINAGQSEDSASESDDDDQDVKDRNTEASDADSNPVEEDEDSDAGEAEIWKVWHSPHFSIQKDNIIHPARPCKQYAERSWR